MNGKRLAIIIFSFISIFFLISGLISAFNYEGVVIEKQEIINVNPSNITLALSGSGNNASLRIDVLIKNPSNFNLKMYAFTALITQHNKTIVEFWRSYYFYLLNPLTIYSHSQKHIIYSENFNISQISENTFNVTLQIVMRFSGFSYFYENPGENFSPQRYYLTDMVMINIEAVKNVTVQTL
ncbi:MAG: hypothetical protein ACP5TX_04605 [Thermoplasmata archaeon]